MEKNLPLDFAPLNFNGEIKKGAGEDNWTYGFTDRMGLIAVFDGCGGSGCMKHSVYRNHTEAYMASRLSSGNVYECMHRSFPGDPNADFFVKRILEQTLSARITANVPPMDPSTKRIKGLRLLPSTMASVLIQCTDGADLLVSPIWAGDSRAYVLDETGLSQITVDDSTQTDPMASVTGVITNVISGDTSISLNHRTYRIKPPFMVVAVTDGCYESGSTPMDMEGMILHTLLESSSVAQWEDNLYHLIGDRASDDHTLCLVSFGYGNFANLQKCFAGRYKTLRRDFLEPLWAQPEDPQVRSGLCDRYRPNYMKYIEGEQR